MAEPTRIAMWSGPRNISTAMMYAFGNRTDTFATDEPLYAHYLAKTGVIHPGAAEVIANGDTDWRSVTDTLAGPVPDGSQIWYQKQMCHHILEGMNLSWTTGFKHCFLLRDPREMLLSLANKIDQIDASSTGLPQQVQLIHEIQKRTNRQPLIVDAKDILENPKEMLMLLCERLSIPFQEEMLSWSAGPKPFDGVWAKHWYDSVWKSTEFSTYQPREGTLSPTSQRVLDEVYPLYRDLHRYRINY